MAAPVGAQPRNLDYYLSRMSGYSKNTIKIQVQGKSEYAAGDTITFRLPTNSIIDLHTLNLRLAGRVNNIGTAAAVASFPRFTQSLIRRMDVTMGGIQTGLGALHDYGFLYYLLGCHKIPGDRLDYDLNATEASAAVTDSRRGLGNGQSSASNTFSVAAGARGPWVPLQMSSWLGVAGGAFMRFLDTNILPDIEIRIMLQPNTVLASDKVGSSTYTLKDPVLTVESISFGDGSYRAMVDARMSTGEPLMVPFYNWAGFESSTGNTTFNQQFTIGTESLNALIGTSRPGNYDSQVLPTIGGNAAGTNSSRWKPQLGADPAAMVNYPSYAANTEGQIIPWYFASISGEAPLNLGFETDGVFTARHQFNIDSKLYPQFIADVLDGYGMLKNMFDANALSLTYGSAIDSLDLFAQAVWAFCVGLDHHADDAGKDHLISGLNTTGSLIPITHFCQMASKDVIGSLKTMCGGSFRPTVFANMTSTLMIYQGRTISVVN